MLAFFQVCAPFSSPPRNELATLRLLTARQRKLPLFRFGVGHLDRSSEVILRLPNRTQSQSQLLQNPSYSLRFRHLMPSFKEGYFQLTKAFSSEE